MTDSTPTPTPRRDAVAALLYTLICILLFPAMVVGYVLWIARLYAGRASGVSGTAQGPLSARWFQHQLGTRQDEAAYRLLMLLPGVSPLAVRLVFGPMRLASRMSGYVPPTFRYPFEGVVTLQNQASARQTFYDQAVEQHLAQVAQLVILGAGFDTRAFRLPGGAPHPAGVQAMRAFEVDTPQTMAVKRQMLAQAGIDLGGVALVSADFEHGDWLSRLVESGFDPSQPTLFLWEGVTPYLERAAVEDTLRKIAGCAKGSRVAFDYLTSEVLQSPALALRVVRRSLQAGGEPLKFGIDSTPPSAERLAELLRACGLTLVEQHTVGQETDGQRALGGFAIAMVK